MPNSTRADVHHTQESFATYQTLPASGLLYAQARLYDPVTSLFLQEDPISSTLPQVYVTDPEQQNSYSYARNNPVTYTDPTGAYIESALDIAFIAYDIGEIAYQTYKLAKGNGSYYDLTTSVLALGADIGGLLTPFGTGFGVATRVARGGAPDIVKHYEPVFDGLWNGTKKYNPYQNAADHAIGVMGKLNSHAKEFGLSTTREYVEKARGFIKSSINDTTGNVSAKITIENGDTIIRAYNKATNEFSSMLVDPISKTIKTKTYFKPSDAKNYFNNQPGNNINLYDYFTK